MNAYPEHITLNGKKTRISEFIQKKHSKHEGEIAAFLMEWFGPADSIEAGTSGSTGTPKIMWLKKEFLIESALRTIQFFNLNPGDRILHCLPVKFIAGKLMVIRALVGHLDLCTTDPATDFSFLQNEKYRFAAMIPHQVQKISDAEPGTGAWFKNLEQLLIGGSSIPPSLENRLQHNPTTCYSSYGMTETATHIALRKVNGNEPDEYYHCLDKITVQASADGCLQIVMPGLAEQPLKTTDIAEVKDEKTFKILGRSDNVIISGGIKYSPEQLERILEPYIHRPFLITALPHESLGQQLVLAVEGNETQHMRDSLKELCRKQLKKFEQPRKIIFTAEIPKTASGKPDRNKLLLQ